MFLIKHQGLFYKGRHVMGKKVMSLMLVALIMIGFSAPSFASLENQGYLKAESAFKAAKQGNPDLSHGVKSEPKTGCYLGLFGEEDLGIHDIWGTAQEKPMIPVESEYQVENMHSSYYIITGEWTPHTIKHTLIE